MKSKPTFRDLTDAEWDAIGFTADKRKKVAQRLADAIDEDILRELGAFYVVKKESLQEFKLKYPTTCA